MSHLAFELLPFADYLIELFMNLLLAQNVSVRTHAAGRGSGVEFSDPTNISD